MSQVRYFTDEDIYGALAAALCKSGVDTVSTPEAGRLAETDESQLEWAATEGRVLVTFNVAHFAALHTAWLQQGRHHAGIERPLGNLLRRLQRLAATLDVDVMQDRLEFLSDW